MMVSAISLGIRKWNRTPTMVKHGVGATGRSPLYRMDSGKTNRMVDWLQFPVPKKTAGRRRLGQGVARPPSRPSIQRRTGSGDSASKKPGREKRQGRRRFPTRDRFFPRAKGEKSADATGWLPTFSWRRADDPPRHRRFRALRPCL
jgi:hypothetical protein